MSSSSRSYGSARLGRERLTPGTLEYGAPRRADALPPAVPHLDIRETDPWAALGDLKSTLYALRRQSVAS